MGAATDCDYLISETLRTKHRQGNIWTNFWIKLLLCLEIKIKILTSVRSKRYLSEIVTRVFQVESRDLHLTLRKIAIWLSKNCLKKSHFFKKIAKNFRFFQKNCQWQFFWKKWKFLAIFFEKMSSFWQFFDSQMAIFRKVSFRHAVSFSIYTKSFKFRIFTIDFPPGSLELVKQLFIHFLLKIFIVPWFTLQFTMYHFT